MEKTIHRGLFQWPVLVLSGVLGWWCWRMNISRIHEQPQWPVVLQKSFFGDNSLCRICVGRNYRFILGEVFISGFFFFWGGGISLYFFLSSGPLVLWSPGPLVPWSPGPLVPWSPGPLVPWSSDTQCIWGGGAAPSPPSPLQLFHFFRFASSHGHTPFKNNMKT